MKNRKTTVCSIEEQSTVVARKKRIRSTSVCVWLSPDELTATRERMAEAGIRNMGAYMRKMALRESYRNFSNGIFLGKGVL